MRHKIQKRKGKAKVAEIEIADPQRVRWDPLPKEEFLVATKRPRRKMARTVELIHWEIQVTKVSAESPQPPT